MGDYYNYGKHTLPYLTLIFITFMPTLLTYATVSLAALDIIRGG